MKFITVITVAMFAAGSAYGQNAEIGTWAGFRKGAASFTFDDGAPSHVSDAGPVFDKYGYKGTFNLVYNWNPNWSGFQSLADNGHEIASHSNSHGQNMSGEEASSKTNIGGKIKQKYGIITVAYPNCNVPNERAVLQNYIVGRICNGSWQGMSDIMGKNGPSNWAKASAIMTGSEGQIKSTNDFTGQMQKAVQSNGWVAFLTHGFSGKNNGSATYSPTDLGAIEGALQWAKQNDKDIWVAPMGFVAMYIKERNAAKIEGSSDSNSMTFELKHNIADSISKYDYPLSIRVKTSWSKVEVTQNGAKLDSKIESGYVYFDAVPNGGKIVVKNGNATGTGNTTTRTTTKTIPSSGSCWASSLGYKCCTSSTVVAYTDSNGQWGIQNDDWCGIPNTNNRNCWARNLGYNCCSTQSCRNAQFSDTDGQWDIENGEWCGISTSNVLC
uniref:Carboxyl esterase family 4 n=1 Tax=Piromyces sp. TaxID=45796 RepID=A0A2S1TZD3_PIRSP|nr:Carboxyl esterase family 4 [Piromyces sp.]